MGHAAQRPEIVWSAIRAKRERAEAETGDGLHLSRAQKWDLVRICGAALASAAFFASPFLLPREAVPDADRAAIVSPSMPIEHQSPQPVLDRIGVVTTEIVVPVQAVLVRTVPRTINPRPKPVPVTVKASNQRQPSTTPSRSLARRVGRAIVGDGRYTVRPFPTLDTNQD